jgi:hypothetical protein
MFQDLAAEAKLCPLARLASRSTKVLAGFKACQRLPLTGLVTRQAEAWHISLGMLRTRRSSKTRFVSLT